MSILFSMIFMIPLVFYVNFWFHFFMFSLLTFIFMSKISMNFMFLNLSFMMGSDLLSFLMILLSFWICMLMILASKKIYLLNINSNYFLMVNLILMIVLYLVFSSMNLFIFYLFFEFSLIPVLLMIMGWGYQPERIQAGVYLMFYTLFASLPMMISIFYLYKMSNSLDFYFIKKMEINNMILYLFMNFVFFIKMPMYLVHLWLPKAHVEAPIAGSMILAGVMLKLGGYGLIRLMILFMKIGLIVNIYFIVLSLMGGFFISLICLNQSDLKSLIAYSSVAHMSLVLSGILTFNYWGMCGALVMMIAHGLCSSGLFCLSNILYERLGSRSIYLNKGMMNIVPSMSLWWFLLCSSNMAAPPSMNLMGEIMLINSLVSWNLYLMIFLSLMSFFSAAYSLYLYSYTQHGKFYSGLYCSMMNYLSEYKLLFLHWFPLNILVLKGEMLFYMF
uniref:NADH dehydrogenase subunit 4 n=1 Tax=Callimerus chinensis TaxID=3028307 RepID=UPI0023D7E04C|nr:NADH dehydrogenase subunit 4 [Callimerus chinensis]WDE20708.1 NADH dehydrogenase subunit 4 [Callimerus chinensis]